MSVPEGRECCHKCAGSTSMVLRRRCRHGLAMLHISAQLHRQQLRLRPAAHRVQPEGSRSAGRRWKARAADNHIPASESESNRWVRSQEVVNRWNAQEVGVCGIAWACIRGVGRTRWQKERSAHDAPSSKIFLGHNPLGRKPPPHLWKLTLPRPYLIRFLVLAPPLN